MAGCAVQYQDVQWQGVQVVQDVQVVQVVQDVQWQEVQSNAKMYNARCTGFLHS